MDRWVADRLVDMVASSASAEDKRGFRREIIAVAAELAGPDPSAVESSLAQSAALCWFAPRNAEAQFARYQVGTSLTAAGSEYHQRRINHCHRRYLSTLRTLAQVHKLARPSIQLNVAQQQLNIAGSPAALGVDPPRGDGQRGLPPPG
jgi:hypothetical protein